MIAWTKIPFMRLLIPLLVGIVIGLFTKLNQHSYIVFVLGFCFFVVHFFLSTKITKKYIKGIFLTLSIACVGVVLVNSSKQFWLKNYYTKSLKPNSVLLIKILEPVAEKRQSYKTLGEVVALKNNDSTTKVCGKIVLYFAKNAEAKKLGYGDAILIKNNIQDLRDAPNPHEFSPKDYLGYRAIYQSCYLKQNHWKKLPFTLGNSIKISCYKARDYCIKVFRKNGLSGDEFAVASAMIVGFEDELRPEIISYFSASGAMHLLSVSGLHIAFVYIILSFLLKPLRRFKHGKRIEFFISVFVLWFYAIVTGFSAPVVRSAIMFSFVVYAKSFDKYLNMFNILALAGFFILAIDPLSIADVGFQLSFLALLSILIIQPIVSELYFSHNWFVQKAWEITSVSISATIGTLPLTFYYFHQFPNYFLLVNLLVIPLSTLLLYTGFAVVLLSWMPYVPYVLTQALKYITMFLNYLLSVDTHLPGSVTTSIQINEIETILLFITVVLFCVYLYSRKARHIIYAAVMFVAFVGSSFIYIVPTLSQQKLIIYSINKHTAIDYFDGNKTYFVADSGLYNHEIDMRYHVYPNRIRHYIKHTETIDIANNFEKETFLKQQHYIQCGNKKLVLLDEQIVKTKHAQKLIVDYVLLTNNFSNGLDYLQENYSFKKLILDASLTKKAKRKLIRELKLKRQTFWDVLSDGAFVVEW